MNIKNIIRALNEQEEKGKDKNWFRDYIRKGSTDSYKEIVKSRENIVEVLTSSDLEDLKREYMSLCRKVKPGKYTYKDHNAHHDGDDFYWEITVRGAKAKYTKWTIPYLDIDIYSSVEDALAKIDRGELSRNFDSMSEVEKANYLYRKFNVYIPNLTEFWKYNDPSHEYEGLTVLAFNLLEDGKTLRVAEYFDAGQWWDPKYYFDVPAEDYPSILSYDIVVEGTASDKEKFYSDLGINIEDEIFFFGYH